MEQKQLPRGIIAKRKPNGEFDTAIPFYCPATPELTEREQLLLDSFKKLMAEGLREYIAMRREK